MARCVRSSLHRTKPKGEMGAFTIAVHPERWLYQLDLGAAKPILQPGDHISVVVSRMYLLNAKGEKKPVVQQATSRLTLK